MKPMDLTASRSSGRAAWVLAVLSLFALSCAFGPRALAQLDGVINGQILDVAGKPWPDMTINAEGDQGQKATTKSDKDGNFTIRGLRSGVYSLIVELPPPNQPYKAAQVQVRGTETPR